MLLTVHSVKLHIYLITFLLTQPEDIVFLILWCIGEVMKHKETKCILNEGMPTHKNPFEKGKLIVTFQVQFPPDKWLPAAKINQLEKLLPAREEVIVPDLAEDHVLQRFDAAAERERDRQRREAYDSDDEGGIHGQRVQCASH